SVGIVAAITMRHLRRGPMRRFAEYAGDTVAGALAAAMAADPSRPMLTYYDDATGERTELSGTTLDNWVAKTANLLVEGGGRPAGARAAVALPRHWRSAAVLLGCWSVGLVVGYANEPPVDVRFLTLDRAGPAGPAADRFVLGLAPMGLPL